MLWHIVERCRRATKLDRIVVATTSLPEDDIVEKLARDEGWHWFRGSSENVLKRIYDAAVAAGADTVVRITGDCPLIDPGVIDQCIDAFHESRLDYISNINPGPRTFPRGLDVEVVSMDALMRADERACEKYEREHVTPYIWENKTKEFRIGQTIVANTAYRGSDHRLTVDYPEDFALIEMLYGRLWHEGTIMHVPDVLQFLRDHPEYKQINAYCVQKIYS